MNSSVVDILSKQILNLIIRKFVVSVCSLLAHDTVRTVKVRVAQ